MAKKKHYPAAFETVEKIFSDVEALDLRGTHRGALANAMATVLLVEELRRLRFTLDGLYREIYVDDRSEKSVVSVVEADPDPTWKTEINPAAEVTRLEGPEKEEDF